MALGLYNRPVKMEELLLGEDFLPPPDRPVPLSLNKPSIMQNAS